MFPSRRRIFNRIGCMAGFGLSFALAGCLSTANDVAPVEDDPFAVAALSPGADTVQRQQTVAAIRARAESDRQNAPEQYPNVFETPSLSATASRSTTEVAQVSSSLSGQAASASRAADEVDASAYDERARWLWWLGRNHVDDTAAEINAETKE